MNSTTFWVPGRPQGKARPRATVMHGRVRMYTPDATAQYEALIAWCWRQAHGTQKSGPVRIEIEARFAPPKGYSRSKRESCLRGELRPTCKPDGDNIAKAVADALNGLAYVDDKNVVEFAVSKIWAAEPGLMVTVSEAKTPETEEKNDIPGISGKQN